MKAGQLIIAAMTFGATFGATAQTLPCAELRAAVEAAETDFAALRGEVLRTETLADLARANGLPESAMGAMTYRQEVYAATRPLPAASCEIRVAKTEDDSSNMSQSAFRCLWQRDPDFEGLKNSLKRCFVDAEIDEDAQSIDLLVEGVSSGEGYRSVSLSAAELPMGGIELTVFKDVCLNRATGGCGDD